MAILKIYLLFRRLLVVQLILEVLLTQFYQWVQQPQEHQLGQLDQVLLSHLDAHANLQYKLSNFPPNSAVSSTLTSIQRTNGTLEILSYDLCLNYGLSFIINVCVPDNPSSPGSPSIPSLPRNPGSPDGPFRPGLPSRPSLPKHHKIQILLNRIR